MRHHVKGRVGEEAKGNRLKIGLLCSLSLSLGPRGGQMDLLKSRLGGGRSRCLRMQMGETQRERERKRPKKKRGRGKADSS